MAATFEDGEEHRGVAPALARVLGLLLAVVLMTGVIRSAVSGLIRVVEAPMLEIQAESLLSLASNASRGTKVIVGRSAPVAVVVLIRSVHASGELARDVRIWVTPSSSFGGELGSVTVPVIYADQTVAVVLPCSRPTGHYRVNVAARRWGNPTVGEAQLPAVRWFRAVDGIRARVTNSSQVRARDVAVVAAFFDRRGSIVGAGQRLVGGLPSGASRSVSIPIEFGAAKATAHAAVFEERA